MDKETRRRALAYASGINPVRLGQSEGETVEFGASTAATFQGQAQILQPMEQFPPYGINHRRIFECPFRLSQDALEDLWLVLEKLSDIVCPLGNVARFTGQREIADAIGASLAPGMDVFNLQRHVAFPAVGASTLPLFQ